MAGVKVKLKGTEKVFKRLEKNIARSKDTGRAMAKAALFGYKDVLEHFRKSEAPAGRWKPLKGNARFRIVRKDAKSYIKTERNPKPLQDTGRLRNSITFKTGKDYAAVGTNVKYAAAHQFGRPSRTIMPVRKKFLRFAVGSKNMIFSKHVQAGAIPARPFLWLSNGAVKNIATEVKNYVFH